MTALVGRADHGSYKCQSSRAQIGLVRRGPSGVGVSLQKLRAGSELARLFSKSLTVTQPSQSYFWGRRDGSVREGAVFATKPNNPTHRVEERINFISFLRQALSLFP